MNRKLLEEFNELAALTKYISEFYNYSGIRDDMDFIEHDNHIWELHQLLAKDGAHPHPDILAFHTLERKPDYKPKDNRELKQFVDNLKFDIRQANKVLEYEFNKFGAEKMREKAPKPDDVFALQSTALKYGCINLLRLV